MKLLKRSICKQIIKMLLVRIGIIKPFEVSKQCIIDLEKPAFFSINMVWRYISHIIIVICWFLRQEGSVGNFEKKKLTCSTKKPKVFLMCYKVFFFMISLWAKPNTVVLLQLVFNKTSVNTRPYTKPIFQRAKNIGLITTLLED